MNNKKILGGAAAIMLGVSVVGGSLAWFTSSDKAINSFKALNVKASVVEEFDKLGAMEIVPGDIVKNDVDIKVDSSAPTFVRVKITKGWSKTELEGNNIKLNYTDGVTDTDSAPTEGKWYQDGEYLYYIGVVKEGDVLNLLDSVEFVPGDNDNIYQDADMKVNVELEAIQAENNAFESGWNIESGSDLGIKLSELSKKLENIKNN